MMIKLPQPYLLFLGDATEARFAKTAFGLKDWAPERCIGEFSLPESTVTTALPQLTPGEAYRRGARALVIGIASRGGALLPSWIPALIAALEAGLDIVSGMHARLADQPELKEAAQRLNRRLIDVRQPPPNIPIATGRKRSGKRLLTVGTDCAVGKKYTALTLASELRQRGVAADFRASGQTGILIAGAGMPLDAVVADFVAGAAELLSPDAAENHWDVVEGQGAVSHPSYSGVSLGLLHGTQPDVIVVCHELGRQKILGLEEYAVPSLEDTIALNLTLARRTNPKVRCGGVSLNTAAVAEPEARAVMAEHAARLRLPVADPMRSGKELAELVASCLAD
jgi:uncharacterized NAD-dependent epimerase/dehydratase family protein